jgi:hypothetical protein
MAAGVVLVIASWVPAQQRGNEKPTSKAPVERAADKSIVGSDWVRLELDDAGKPQSMQTAIVRYKSKADPAVMVDLVGAVHVGDKAYYKDLNDRFEQYDVLLYELVAPDGTVVEPGRGTSSRHPLGALQNSMKEMLELEHQLEQVDYTKDNFVHADMSPDAFFKSMKNRDESFAKMYFRMIGTSLAYQSRMTAQGESADVDILKALMSDDRARMLKIALAKQLADMESLLSAFGGEEGSTLITERNKKALEVLKDQLAQGKKKIGIFYGAGHLNDMHERLQNDFKLDAAEITWLPAWKLTADD